MMNTAREAGIASWYGKKGWSKKYSARIARRKAKRAIPGSQALIVMQRAFNPQNTGQYRGDPSDDIYIR